MNENHNNFPPESSEKKLPWFLAPDIKPPKGYNPYKDEALTDEDENPELPPITERFPWESFEAYEYRKQSNELYAKKQRSDRLKRFADSAMLPILITLFMMTGFSGAFIMFDGIIPAALYNTLYIAHMVLTYVLFFPVAYFIYSVGKSCKAYTFFAKPEASKFYIARWTVIAVGLTHATAIAFFYLFELFKKLGLHVNDIETVTHDGPVETVLYFAAVVICAPIFEEILFRGFLLTKLSKYGSWFAITVSAVMFGLFHQNHSQLFFTTVFGIIAGFLAMRTKSIIPSIIAHVALNGYAFITELFLLFTTTTGSGTNMSIDGPAAIVAIVGILDILSYILMIIGAVMLVTEIATNKAQFSVDTKKCSVTLGARIKMLFSSPITVILVLILVSNLITISFIDMDYLMSMLEY